MRKWLRKTVGRLGSFRRLRWSVELAVLLDRTIPAVAAVKPLLLASLPKIIPALAVVKAPMATKAAIPAVIKTPTPAIIVAPTVEISLLALRLRILLISSCIAVTSIVAIFRLAMLFLLIAV